MAININVINDENGIDVKDIKLDTWFTGYNAMTGQKCLMYRVGDYILQFNENPNSEIEYIKTNEKNKIFEYAEVDIDMNINFTYRKELPQKENN